jgi:hypothetical protein
MSRPAQFLGNPLTVCGDFISLTRLIPGTHFCYIVSRLQSHSAARRIISIETSSDHTWELEVERILGKC